MSESQSLLPMLRWLVTSRWLVLSTQALLIITAKWLAELAIPPVPLLSLVVLGAVSNLLLEVVSRRARGIGVTVLSVTLAFDILLLTLELWFSGGPANPFSSLYLVYISFAAAMLSFRWTWGLVGLASLGYAVLYLGAGDSPLASADHATQMRLHLQGMWLAFLIAAVLIGHSVTYAQRLLSRQRDELQQNLLLRERHCRLTALATLSAGAAHELATPLSTIAVLAKEFEHQLRDKYGHLELAEDAALLRRQVTRCRNVLDRLATQVTEEDRGARASIGDVVSLALRDLERAADVVVRIPTALESREFPWPPHAVSVSLRNVLKNALDASPRGAEVRVTAQHTPSSVVLEVEDSGTGMPASVLRRATEPFFTTKTSDRGTGLGLFLTQGLMEQLGVHLELRSQRGVGTTVRFTFPCAPGVA